MEKFYKLYKNTGNCEDQQKYKEMIEAVMVSIPEGCPGNSTMQPNTYLSTKNLVKKIALSVYRDIVCQT